MKDPIPLMRKLLSTLSGTLSTWTWQNRDLYPSIKLWEEVAEFLDFPLSECLTILNDRGRGHARSFISEWLIKTEVRT